MKLSCNNLWYINRTIIKLIIDAVDDEFFWTGNSTINSLRSLNNGGYFLSTINNSKKMPKNKVEFKDDSIKSNIINNNYLRLEKEKCLNFEILN